MGFEVIYYEMNYQITPPSVRSARNERRRKRDALELVIAMPEGEYWVSGMHLQQVGIACTIRRKPGEDRFVETGLNRLGYADLKPCPNVSQGSRRLWVKALLTSLINPLLPHVIPAQLARHPGSEHDDSGPRCAKRDFTDAGQ